LDRRNLRHLDRARRHRRTIALGGGGTGETFAEPPLLLRVDGGLGVGRGGVGVVGELCAVRGEVRALVELQDHVFELVSENWLLRDLLDTERFANRARNAATAELLGPLHDHDTVAALLGNIPDGLLALHTGDGRVLYPAFQFDDATVVSGITAIVELAASSGRSHWSIAAWLASRVTRPDELWHMDMTKVWTAAHGWVYLHVIARVNTRT
jgi:hypothetical protein